MNLCELRRKHVPKIPSCLKDLQTVTLLKKEKTTSLSHQEEIKKQFLSLFGSEILEFTSSSKQSFSALKVGVVFSGGQAAGGHNVISGLYDAITQMHEQSVLIGFLGGPSGIVDGKYKQLDRKEIDLFRNQGGFDMIGSGRTKIETIEQLEQSANVITSLHLDGLVIIGGDDSNTNAAVLAEYFIEHGVKTTVVGVPKTIDGDLKNDYVDISFGFDTATKIYSEMIGNIAKDALSAKKYYHFIKLMGRSASHIALECALYTHPNYTFISEEVGEKQISLSTLIHELCDMIEQRSKAGKDYGIVLIPEGLIEEVPEIKQLIKELNNMLATGNPFQAKALTPSLRSIYDSFPDEIKQQLILDRDPHGNVQVSHIQTEKLLISLTETELEKRKQSGRYLGKFNPIAHFFGYEGRSGLPSNFDANYCYSLGRAASILIANKCSGYMVAIKGLSSSIEKSRPYGIPITSLLTMESRKGKTKAVIQKALVDLNGKPFKFFESRKAVWVVEDNYQFPGPIQFCGEESLTDSSPISLSF
ncbi:MAG: diphosphate--fructose-6-phosphate 1-phosphotransferase [Chlamydiales bacterium]|nr:diphosphate--fructose-6-phosphate 1-phosphotransferase [Chlamydiales bacterium]